MNGTGTDIRGGCLCGAVRFRSTAAPLTARYCWCTNCQKFGAGNATVNVVFSKPNVTVEGELAVYESLADSGSRMRRSFCPRCGTPLFSEAEPRPHLIIIRAGALDDPEAAAPASTIWASSAPSWACIDPDLPQHAKAAPPA